MDWYTCTWVDICNTNASLRLCLNMNTCTTKVPSRTNADKLQVGGWVKVWLNILLWVTWFVLKCLVLLTLFSYVVGSRSAPKTNIMLYILRCTLIQRSRRRLPRNHGSHLTISDFPVRSTKIQSCDVPLRELYYLQQVSWGCECGGASASELLYYQNNILWNIPTSVSHFYRWWECI